VLAFGGGLNATLEGGDISDTQAGSTVLVLANSTLTVQGTKFSSNKVRKGAVYGLWLSQLVVQRATLVNNTAEWEGGGMYLVGSNCTLLGSTFDSNVAAKAGGAAYVKFSSLHVDSTEFHSNTAPVGGAVAVYNNSSVAFTNSSLQSNTARPVDAAAMKEQSRDSYYMLGVGGALYVEHSGVSIARSKVLHNRAVMDGGERGNTRG
jgi:parallel beta-helix repeat protein